MLLKICFIYNGEKIIMNFVHKYKQLFKTSVFFFYRQNREIFMGDVSLICIFLDPICYLVQEPKMSGC